MFPSTTHSIFFLSQNIFKKNLIRTFLKDILMTRDSIYYQKIYEYIGFEK